MIHAPLWCPTCGSAMAVTTGSVMFDRAVQPVVDQFLACTACPVVTQVASETGRLIDIEGQWEVADLSYRLEVELVYPTPPPMGRLLGRRDS